MDEENIDSGTARQAVRMTDAEFRAVARLGVDGAEREIVRRMNDEQKAATEHERMIVREVKARGGVCRPEGMTQEEWANRLPRSLRGSRSRNPSKAGRGCAPIDELAQEYADRGMIGDAYQDEAIDFIAAADVTQKMKAPPPEPKELRKAARRLVDNKASRAAQELVQSSQSLRCDAKGTPMKGMHGLVREKGSTSMGMGDARSLVRSLSTGKYVELGERASLTALSIFALSQSNDIAPKVVFGATTVFFGFLTLAKAFEL